MKKWTDRIIQWVMIGILGVVVITILYLYVEHIVSNFWLYFLAVTSTIGLLAIIIGIIWGIHRLLWNWGVKRRKVDWLLFLESREEGIWFWVLFIILCAITLASFAVVIFGLGRYE